MDLIVKLRELTARISKQLDHIQTEQATKNALVMPFISGLGYNVFDPTEVTPELNADVGIKKGEKVAIKGVDDIYGLADRLKATVVQFDKVMPVKKPKA